MSSPRMPALAITLAALSYIGAVLWLYERSRAGNIALKVIAFIALGAAIESLPAARLLATSARWLWILYSLSSGLLMGSTMAAMLLGHWYLNTPTMQLLPLKKLIQLMTVAAILRGLLSGLGSGMYFTSGGAHGELVGIVAREPAGPVSSIEHIEAGYQSQLLELGLVDLIVNPGADVA